MKKVSLVNGNVKMDGNPVDELFFNCLINPSESQKSADM